MGRRVTRRIGAAACIAAVLYAAHAVVRGSWRIARRDLPVVAGFGLVGVSLFYGSYMLAVERGGRF